MPRSRISSRLLLDESDVDVLTAGGLAAMDGQDVLAGPEGCAGGGVDRHFAVFDRSSGSSSHSLAVSPDGRWRAVTDVQIPHVIDITPPLAP